MAGSHARDGTQCRPCISAAADGCAALPTEHHALLAARCNAPSCWRVDPGQCCLLSALSHSPLLEASPSQLGPCCEREPWRGLEPSEQGPHRHRGAWYQLGWTSRRHCFQEPTAAGGTLGAPRGVLIVACSAAGCLAPGCTGSASLLAHLVPCCSAMGAAPPAGRVVAMADDVPKGRGGAVAVAPTQCRPTADGATAVGARAADVEAIGSACAEDLPCACSRYRSPLSLLGLPRACRRAEASSAGTAPLAHGCTSPSTAWAPPPVPLDCPPRSGPTRVALLPPSQRSHAARNLLRMARGIARPSAAPCAVASRRRCRARRAAQPAEVAPTAARAW